MKKFIGLDEFAGYLPGAKKKAPASGYGPAIPGKPAPTPAYGAPAHSHESPASGYGASAPQSHAPQSTVHPLTSAPVFGYGAPPSQSLALQQPAPQTGPQTQTQPPAPVSGYGPAPQTLSQPQTPPPSSLHVPNVACVTLNSDCIIRFMNFPPADVEAFKDVIVASWPKGVYPTEHYGEAIQIKFHGSPWKASYRGVDTTRLLMRNLLASFYERGWVLEGGIDFSKKNLNKGKSLFLHLPFLHALIFRHRPSPPTADFLVISFDRCDRLKIVPPPSPDLSAAILTHLGAEVKTHTVTESGALDVDMRGDPWHPEGKETVKATLLVVGLLGLLEGRGWGLYGSLNIGGDSTGVDADVFVMRKATAWVPGMPVGRSGFIFE